MTTPKSSNVPSESDLWTCMCQILTGDVDAAEFVVSVTTFAKYVENVIPKCFLDAGFLRQGSLLISVIRSGLQRVYRVCQNRENADSATVILERCILDCFKKALQTWPNTEHCNNLLAEFFFAVFNSSHENVLPKCIDILVEFKELPPVWNSFVQRSRENIKPFTYFITQVLTHPSSVNSLNILFGPEINENPALCTFLTETLLTERIQPKNSVKRWSYLVAEYIAKFNSPGPVFVRLVRLFVDHAQNMKSVQFTHQLQVAVAVLDFARRLPSEFHPQAKQIVTQDVLKTINCFLNTTDKKRRQLGLAVSEALLRLYPPTDGKLPIGFDFDRNDSFVKELFKIIIDPDESGNCPAVLIEMTAEKRSMKKEVPTEKCILDSDDSDDDGDDAYMKELKDIARSRIGEFDTSKIQSLLLDLKNDDITVYFSALTQLIVALENRYITDADIGLVFVKRAIILPLRPEIPNCEIYHYRLLELILAARPDLAASIIASAVSMDCDMEQRTAIFRGLVGAANLLANGRGFDHLGHISEQPIENEKPIKTHTIDGHPRTGILTRVNPSFLKIARHTHKNVFIHKAPLFLFPLVTNKFPFLDDFETDPMKRVIISQLIFTAALILVAGYGSPNYVSMCRAVADYVKSVREIDDPLVQESIVFAYGAMIRGLPPMTLYEHFYADIQEWIGHVNGFSELVDEDPTSALAATLQVTVPVIYQALMSGADGLKMDDNEY